MKAYITRDSVCAADDVDAPNARELTVPDGLPVDELVRQVIRLAGLPPVAGGKATWCISSIEPLAVIAQQWSEPRLLTFIPPERSRLDIADGVFRSHISYFAQQDPEVVFEVLRRLQIRAR
jgi:hypothetical protein